MASSQGMGQVLREFRQRPVADYRRDMHYHWFVSVGVGILWSFLCMLLLLGLMPKLLDGAGLSVPISVTMARAMAGTITFVAILLALWHALLLPRSDFLVLYERGFRGRIGLRRFSCLFGQLESIHSGTFCDPDPKALHPWAVTVMKERAALALTVVPKRGNSFPIDGIRARFAAEDVDFLLETAREKCLH